MDKQDTPRTHRAVALLTEFEKTIILPYVMQATNRRSESDLLSALLLEKYRELTTSQIADLQAA